MKITEIATAMTGQPMGDDPIKAIDDAITQKMQQRQALDKEIADLRASKPKAQAAMQQQKSQQTQQQSQQNTTVTPKAAPSVNTNIQPAAVQPQ